MMFHENRLPADDSHEISCHICYFRKGGKILNCRLLQIIGGALSVSRGGGRGAGVPDTPSSGKLHVAIGFLRNTGTDPLEKQLDRLMTKEGLSEPPNPHPDGIFWICA